VILQTLACCIGIVVGIFAVEIALHYKELVAAIINHNKRKSWGLQKRWWWCRQRRMKTVRASSKIEVVNEN
jgi:hypothetical protein